MKAQELSRKYALAVFGLALEQWLLPLKTVQEQLAGNSQLAGFLQDANHPFAERQQKLNDIIPLNAEQTVRNFLYTLLKNDDIDLLADVLTDIQQMSRGGPQVQVARVNTAITLSDHDKEQFRQKLRAKYGANLEFVFAVDPTIVGGVVVQIGDKVIDGSVATRLEAMSNALGIKR
ncbi:MAG: ATP synthase F1 subunit delta [Anaerolineae bacterium]|nr:ATP synthase F1 subunit delta [Anaerolineae bacterium]